MAIRNIDRFFLSDYLSMTNMMIQNVVHVHLMPMLTENPFVGSHIFGCSLEETASIK